MKLFDLFESREEFPPFNNIKLPREDINDVIESNTNFGRVVGKRWVDISSLDFGISVSGTDKRKVEQLIKAFKLEDAYFEMPIVDHTGEVIEGQHRLNALYKLGVKKLPVFVYRDLSKVYDTSKMRQAIESVGNLRMEHINQIIEYAIEAMEDSDSMEDALNYYNLPEKFIPFYEVAIKSLK
jgi:hypothetical protein